MLGRALMTTRIACSCNYRQNARPRFIIHILQAHSSCKKLPVRTQATGQKQNSSAAAGSTVLLYNYAWICKVFKKHAITQSCYAISVSGCRCVYYVKHDHVNIIRTKAWSEMYRCLQEPDTTWLMMHENQCITIVAITKTQLTDSSNYTLAQCADKINTTIKIVCVQIYALWNILTNITA